MPQTVEEFIMFKSKLKAGNTTTSSDHY